MNPIKKQNPTAVLGLAFDGNRLEGVVLRRTNGSAEVAGTVTATLTLDLLNNEPELVGREIRNQLDAAEIRERRCVVALPAHWVLTTQAKLPEIPEEDVPGFLEIEAERAFPYEAAALQSVTSRYTSPRGEKYATQLAVARDHIDRLDQVLMAAQLRPASFSLGLTAWRSSDVAVTEPGITLLVGESAVEMEIASGSGIAAFRTLEGAYDTEGTERRVQSDLVARELRITLGQLPTDLRDQLKQLEIVGAGKLAAQLADDIRPRAQAMGLRVNHVTESPAQQYGLRLPAGQPASTALSVAAQYLSNSPEAFEFLPPKPTLWQQLASRYSSKRLAWVGSVAVGVVAIVGILFLYQQIQLNSLNSRWNEMKPRVDETNDLVAKIRKYRPWFDENHMNLTILERMAEAFPEDGVVNAKSVEIRTQSGSTAATVSCSGSTRDNLSLQKTLANLRATKEIAEVHLDYLKGNKSPMQFTLNFHWGEAKQP